jgi:hypothetical protein
MTGPTFLVVGAGRSGTTGLVEGLRRHPDVFVTTPKEPDYFAYAGQRLAFTGPGDDLAVNRPSVTDRADYLSLYPQDPALTALGEASASTLYHHERSIPEILRVAPEARVVVLLREPVARAGSAFDYLAGQGREPAPTLLDAVADEDRRVRDGWAHLWHYTRMSYYADAVEAFLDAFGADRVGVWFHDAMTEDYPETLRQVLRFIGTEPRPGELDEVPVVNVSGTPRSRLVHGAMQAARGNETVRRLGQRMTTFRMREAVRRRLVTKHDVDPAVRSELEPLFADDLARLSALLPAEGQPAWLRPASLHTR